MLFLKQPVLCYITNHHILLTVRRSQIRKMGKIGLNQPLIHKHSFPRILANFSLFSPLQIVAKKKLLSGRRTLERRFPLAAPQVTPVLPSTPRSYKWSFTFAFLHQILDVYLFSPILSTFPAHSPSWISWPSNFTFNPRIFISTRWIHKRFCLTAILF